jgi:hypothetical protein
MDELESRSTLAQIINVRIERHEYVLSSVVKKKVVAACVIHGDIPYGGACPPAGGTHDGSKYPRPEGRGSVGTLA